MPFVVLVVVGVAAGTWLLGRVRTLDEEAAAPGARPGVTVVVPARDEEASLPALLASLAAQSLPPARVLVVDDGSTDATAARARAHGAEVLPAPPVPPGWLGKPWACHVGAEAATTELVVFLDADTCLAPDALARLVGVHGRRGGLVSVQPFHRTARAYEQLSAACNLVAMMGTGAFTPAPPRPASAAFGPCLMTSRADHRAAGGHAAVRAEVVEDIHLARAYRAVGLPVWCLAGGTQLSYRMYPGGLRSLVDGWSKNLAAGATLVRPLPVLGAVAWVAAGLAVGTRLVVEGLGWVTGRHGAPVAVLAAYVVLVAQWGWMLRRVGAFRWWVAPAFPVALGAFVGLFARSALLGLLRRPVGWRGRPVPVGRRASRGGEP